MEKLIDALETDGAKESVNWEKVAERVGPSLSPEACRAYVMRQQMSDSSWTDHEVGRYHSIISATCDYVRRM